MSGWNRLTNELREALTTLPIWTTEADRRGALSYENKYLEGAHEAVKAVRAGDSASTNLGLLIAIARYEDAGWMPDGCFEQWRRWRAQGDIERLNIKELVQWLGAIESSMRLKLRDRESALTNAWLLQEKQVAMTQDRANEAHKLLYAHHKKLILACLSIGDDARAQAQRVAAGSAWRRLDNLHHKHSTQSSTGACTRVEGPAVMKQLDDGADKHVTAKLSGSDIPRDKHCSRNGTTSCELHPRGCPGALFLLSSEEREVVEAWRHAVRPLAYPSKESEYTHNTRSAILDILLKEATPVPSLNSEDARELAERRGLDALRKDQLEELLTRRKADLTTEEREALGWLKQLMGSIALRADRHKPVLIELTNRLLSNPK
jgi:hypothetical protein